MFGEVNDLLLYIISISTDSDFIKFVGCNLISSKEIARACEKKMPYNFTYFIIICKLYKSKKAQTKKKKKKKQQSSGGRDEPEILWSNPEEELIDQVWCVKVVKSFH
jgi:hypothetical protein